MPRTITPYRAALLATTALALVCMFPLWACAHPPLQDYPQHLFGAKLISQWLSPAGLSPGVYQVQLNPNYSVFYLLVAMLQLALPLAAAGRAALSIYFVLTGLAAWRLVRLGTPERPAWGGLLLFPLALNQFYYLGMIHYIYAMPLLFLALLDLHAAVLAGWTRRRALLHALLLVALFFVHPVALLVYVVVAALWLAVDFRDPLRRGRRAAVLAVAMGLGLVWFVTWALSAPPPGAPTQIVFSPVRENAIFLAYVFTGMRAHHGLDALTLLVYLVCAALTLGLAWRQGVTNGLLARLAGAALVLTVAIVLFGPFAYRVPYVNLRWAPIGYFCLALLASLVRFPPRWAGLLLVLIVTLLALGVRKELAISRESAQLDPLITQMAPNQTVLPLVFDSASPECDAFDFSPHLHDHFSYSLHKGGVSPYVFGHQTPIHLRPGAVPAAPGTPVEFRWELHHGYHYYLVRGGSEKLFAYMERQANLRGISGAWRLYENREPFP